MELKGGVGRNDPVPLTCQDGNASIARAEEQTVSLPARTRTMAVTSAAGLGRPRRWAAGLAWGCGCWPCSAWPWCPGWIA